MGTNYYLNIKDDVLHIGKSSGGWCFSLHVIPELNINNLDDWKNKWKNKSIIKNEYGDKISKKEMLDIITNRYFNRVDNEFYGYRNEEEFHIINHSEPGPNGLVRHKVNDMCVGHGEGTWDYIIGEFS